MLFCYKHPFISIFFEQMQRGEIPLRSFSFLLKKITKMNWETPKEEDDVVCFILEWRKNNIFQGIIKSCIRQGIHFSIQFTRLLWLLNKTTEVEYGLIITLDIQIKRAKRKFPSAHPLAWKQKYYHFFDLSHYSYTQNFLFFNLHKQI